MTMLAERKEGQVLTLADYEARIWIYKEQIGTGYIGIGRTLTEAKAAKVVPHGQWESWVEKTTGLSIRQAQRCMQAAEEIRDGSALARLEMSKALLLLSSGLEKDEQEALAEKAAEENSSLRAMQDEVKRLKLQVVESTGAAADIREKLKAAEAERDQVTAQMRANFRQFQDRLNDETGKAYERGRQENAAETEREIRKEFQNKIDFIGSQRDLANAAVQDLRKQLQDAQIEAGTKWDDGYAAGQGEADLMNKKIRKLERDREDLLKAAEEAEKRAADAEAKAEKLAAMEEDDDAAQILGTALHCFLIDCEDMPLYPADLRKDREKIGRYLDRLEAWCRDMRSSLGKVSLEAEGVIV